MPLKTSENLWFSDVFRGYRKRVVAWNMLLKMFYVGSINSVMSLLSAKHNKPRNMRKSFINRDIAVFIQEILIVLIFKKCSKCDMWLLFLAVILPIDCDININPLSASGALI